MKMFKKSLIAASVAALATTAVAGTITAQTTKIALEGAVSAGTIGINDSNGNGNIQSDVNVSLETGAEYIANDVLEIYVTGASISELSGVTPSLYNTTTPGAANASFIDLNEETGRIRFRIGSGNISTGQTLRLQNVVVDSSGASEGDKVSANARAVSLNSSIGNYDTSASATVAEFDKQYAVAVGNEFSQTIDVNESRKLFVDEAPENSDDTDTVEITVSNPGSGWAYAATPSENVHEITASDFSYTMAFDANEDGELSASELCASSGSPAITVPANVSCSLSGNKLTVTDTNPTIGSLTTLTFNAPGSSSSYQLTAQSFAADVTVKGTLSGSNVSSTVASGTDVGEWELNGASVYVPYMPYADGLSQIIYVSNSGSQSGSIEVTAFDDAGNEYGPYDLGTVAGKDITKLTGGLEDALSADGFTNGKLAFTVTVTAPDETIDVYTGYNAGNDRGLVINSSNQ